MCNHKYCPGVCVSVFSLVLSPHPVLEASPSKPVEGRSVTLTCKIDLPAQRQSVQFCFSCNDNFLGSGCSRSPKLQIPALWRKWPDYYQCIAVTTSLTTNRWSLPIRIPVQRIPVSDVSLKTRPPGGRVMEGNRLVLICSVANATGNITYLWYRGARGSNLGTKTQHSLTAEFEIAEVNRSDAQQYYCAADNGYGPVPSELVSIDIRGESHRYPSWPAGLLGAHSPSTLPHSPGRADVLGPRPGSARLSKRPPLISSSVSPRAHVWGRRRPGCAGGPGGAALRGPGRLSPHLLPLLPRGRGSGERFGPLRGRGIAQLLPARGALRSLLLRGQQWPGRPAQRRRASQPDGSLRRRREPPPSSPVRGHCVAAWLSWPHHRGPNSLLLAQEKTRKTTGWSSQEPA